MVFQKKENKMFKKMVFVLFFTFLAADVEAGLIKPNEGYEQDTSVVEYADYVGSFQNVPRLMYFSNPFSSEHSVGGHNFAPEIVDEIKFTRHSERLLYLSELFYEEVEADNCDVGLLQKYFDKLRDETNSVAAFGPKDVLLKTYLENLLESHQEVLTREVAATQLSFGHYFAILLFALLLICVLVGFISIAGFTMLKRQDKL